MKNIKSSHIYLEIKPLAVPVGVEVGPQVQLVIRLSDPNDLAKVSALEARLEPEGVWQLRLQGRKKI